MTKLLLLPLLLIPATSLSAGVLFFDDFESGSLSPANWSSNIHGQVVADPLAEHGNVLNFWNTQGGGDLYSVVVPNATTYYLSFDYLYNGGLSSVGGGYIGVNAPGETWLLGNCGVSNGCAAYPGLDQIPANTWQHVTLSFTLASVGAGPVQLKLEQFTGYPTNAYFDNIALTDDAFFEASAPEPASWMMMLGGAAVAFGARRWRTRTAVN